MYPTAVKLEAIAFASSRAFKSFVTDLYESLPITNALLFVIIGSDEDIISIKINPFSQVIEHFAYPLEKVSDKELALKQQTKAIEIFEKWQKEN